MRRLVKYLCALGAGLVALSLIVGLVAFAMGGRLRTFYYNDGDWSFTRPHDHYGDHDYWENQGADSLVSPPAVSSAVPPSSEEAGGWEPTDGWTRVDVPANVAHINLKVFAGRLEVRQDDSLTAPQLQYCGFKESQVRAGWDDDEWEASFNSGRNTNIDALWTKQHQVLLVLPAGEGLKLDVELSASAGEFSQLTLHKLDVEADASSANLSEVTVRELSLDSKAGTIELDEVTSAHTEIDCKTGSILGTGDFSGKTEIDCDMGDVELTLQEPEDYGYQIKCNMGNVTLDDENFAALRRKVTNNPGASAQFYIDCDMGNVQVDFDLESPF